ncbi:hypothetical protein Tco_0776766 [Tanacetum coccineum]
MKKFFQRREKMKEKKDGMFGEIRCADMEPDKKGWEAAMAENTIQNANTMNRQALLRTELKRKNTEAGVPEAQASIEEWEKLYNESVDRVVELNIERRKWPNMWRWGTDFTNCSWISSKSGGRVVASRSFARGGDGVDVNSDKRES